MKAFCIKNHVDQTTFEAVPWEYKVKHTYKTKEQLWGWLQKSSADHCCYSFNEPIEPKLRVSKDMANPLTKIHALVADYDVPISDELVKTMGDRFKEYMPMWYGSTISGHGRCIYAFEEPISVPSPSYAKLLMRVFKKKLGLKNLLPGLDEPALEDPSKYYEVGTGWTKTSGDVVSKAFLQQCMYEAGNKYDWRKVEDLEIPLKDVKEELEKQFPGRWQGTFEEGARSVVPFDPNSKNPTACIVRKTGLQCFSQEKTFYSWKEVLGPKFVDQYKATILGTAIEFIYFDGTHYWRKTETGSWTNFGVSDISRTLRIRGINSIPGKNEVASDMDLCIHRIQEHQSVTKAVPLVHRPSGLIRDGARMLLNIAETELITPNENQVPGPQGYFPFIWDYLDGFFDPPDQLDFFLAWFQHWYKSALDREMTPGQAIFISGPVGVGKTFLSNVLCSIPMGGHRDATRFLIGETAFNDHLFEVAVWTVDDSLPISKGMSKTLEFSANTKKIVANQDLEVSTKFRKGALVTWNGRIMVSCNQDPESLRILPELDINIKDKVMFFRAADRQFTFLSPKDNRIKVREEMPFFLRWLIDWVPPAHTQGTARFGVESYHEEEMLEEAMRHSMSDTFRETLETFMEAINDTGVTDFNGTATDMLAQMEMVAEIPGSVLRTYTPTSIGRRLAQLENIGYPVHRKRTARGRIFSIDFIEIQEYHKKKLEQVKEG